MRESSSDFSWWIFPPFEFFGQESYDFHRFLPKNAIKRRVSSPLPYFFANLGKSTLLFTPEHIPWLAGPVSVPGGTAGRVLFGLRVKFIIVFLRSQWRRRVCNITVILVGSFPWGGGFPGLRGPGPRFFRRLRRRERFQLFSREKSCKSTLKGRGISISPAP